MANKGPYSTAKRLVKFWEKVDQRGPDDCWVFRGSRNSAGYGQLWIEGRSVYAHRFAYESLFGPIPTRMSILHSCDNRACVNPAHLRVGTALENSQDMVKRGRHWNQKLTIYQVCRILDRAFRLPTPAEIAKDYGVNEETIRSIIKARTWRSFWVV